MNPYLIYQSGGYPQGYPPQPMQMQQAMNSPYSPFPNSQLANVYVTPNGQVMGAGEGPISNQNIPNPPVPPTPPPVMGGQVNGYNPFAQYGATNQQPPQQQFGGYMNQPGYYQQPFMGIPFGYSGYYVNSYEMQYQAFINDQLYSSHFVGFDPFDCLKDAVLTDEEKRLSAIHTPKGYNYNGAPYYDNTQITEYNKIYKKTKDAVVDFWTRLSMAAHNACGDDITWEEVHAYYDPDERMKNNAYANPVKNYYDMSKEELEYMNKMSQVDQTAILARKFEMADYYQQMIEQKRAEGYAKIKQSHDQILGLTPENMTLKNYMDNAGLLLADIKMREQRMIMKDGTNKYNRDNYKNMVSNGNNINNQPISIFSDDSYVPLESRIKEKYLTSKANSLANLGGYTPSPPPFVDPQTAANRQAFIEYSLRGVKI